MAMADVVGQERAVSRLRRAWAAGRLAQAYSFVGPEGVGKRTTALALAQVVNCQRPVAGEMPDACGACLACRKIAAGNHPDVTLVSPAEKTVIDIDQIRDVAGRATLRAYEGATKVWILDPADRMQEPAANALLKTLEEPPGSALFVLVTTTPSALLPTVRSRCQEVRFELLGADALGTILGRHGRPPETWAAAVALAGGSASRALDLDPEEDRQAQEQVLGDVWGCLGSLPALLACAEAHGRDRDACKKLTAMLQAFCRDVVVARVGGGALPLTTPVWAETVGRLAAAAPTDAWLRMEEALRQARWALERNANPRLTLERLLLRMREAMQISEEVVHAPRGAR
jgi:DNA polymerase-3 subunit delta'